MMPVGSRAALTACRVFRPTGPTSSWSPADMVAADAVMMAEGASGGQDGLRGRLLHRPPLFNLRAGH